MVRLILDISIVSASFSAELIFPNIILVDAFDDRVCS